MRCIRLTLASIFFSMTLIGATTSYAHGSDESDSQCSEYEYLEIVDFSTMPDSINSDEFLLTKITSQDVVSLAEIILRDGVGRYYNINFPQQYDCIDYIIEDVINWNEDMESPCALRYALKSTVTKDPIGEVIVKVCDDEDRSIDMGYWISTGARGHGYAHKAAVLVIDELLKSGLPLNVNFDVVEENIASIKTIDKIISSEKSKLGSVEISKVKRATIILRSNHQEGYQDCNDDETFIMIEESLIGYCSGNPNEQDLHMQHIESQETKKEIRINAINTIDSEVVKIGGNEWNVINYKLHFNMR